MKTTKPIKNRFELKRAAQLKQLAKIGPFVEGSLIGVRHPACKHVAWRLTFKVKGKTRTVYVPVDMAREIKEWTREYRRLKTLIRRVTRNSLALIHGHVAARRAANRAQRLSMKT
ncbi:MAG: DUF6788 family protein [Kiritimatiellia bacterium]|jgi:hypothetical protein